MCRVRRQHRVELLGSGIDVLVVQAHKHFTQALSERHEPRNILGPEHRQRRRIECENRCDDRLWIRDFRLRQLIRERHRSDDAGIDVTV